MPRSIPNEFQKGSSQPVRLGEHIKDGWRKWVSPDNTLVLEQFSDEVGTGSVAMIELRPAEALALLDGLEVEVPGSVAESELRAQVDELLTALAKANQQIAQLTETNGQLSARLAGMNNTLEDEG